ncbi:adenine deaminase Ade [Gottschalkia acidurici 9a]|uniref:Adenine deaminase n=1 Tax=Gottschalkia acidurici (strain ATCC 7906 / DSM 604 / BCRC 14475 / CIP 104303 / KCTC 5404 / NCIMB 10678 / 9a) TaxID=1128398 RepID=K0AYV8_GOTA9|nr:adenine deaminase C-terminal domain-containing protein [Gottschalkia acidurici]AFS77972.1 adenine deaminase Ade [Gottschalkia acidurici 9a]
MLNAKALKKTVDYREMIDVLMSDKVFADKVLNNGNVVNVLTRKTYKADIAIKGEYILLVGDCKELIGPETEVVDVSGKYISPGFIDSHMHFESSMLTITEFSRLSIPSGTTTLIGDPHEIGNVLGAIGMKAMADEASVVPNHVHLPVPALTPDCPALETAGVDVTSNDMDDLLNYPNVIGIGEFQGFSNAKHVYRNTPEIVSDLVASSVYASSIGKIVDGNAPELFGRELAAHIVACAGECSDHETTTKAEAMEKLDQGVYLFMREGSTQRNMAECIRAVTEEGYDSRRCILATDDMVASDLETKGHMDDIVQRTIKEGVDPIEAIQMATINAATYFGFKDRGVLAPAKLADIAVINDLNEMTIDSVYLGGKLVAKDGKLLIDLPKYTYPDSVKNSVKRGPVSLDEITIKSDKNRVTARCIECIPDENLTGGIEVELKVENGIVVGDLSKDVNPIVCIERHGRTKGNVGKTFVTGIGLKSGAIAESVSHDTHNIIATGSNHEDIVVAINRVIEMGGGLALAKDGKVIDELALPVGGLITDELDGHEVSAKISQLEKLAKEDLGVKIHGPFMHLSFLSLSTSPKWKITDKGLVDVNNFEILSPIVEK